MATPRTPGIWFPAKRYGWGWGPPLTWQGWVVLAGWIVILLAGLRWLPQEQPVAHALYALVMTAALVAICWAKGERPRWRWGAK